MELKLTSTSFAILCIIAVARTEVNKEVGNVSVNSSTDDDISRILQFIRENGGYDRRIRPNYKGKPVSVAMSMYISDISSISEVNMDITLDFYLRQIWHDPRLRFDELWNEELVIGGEFINEIWRPDTFFVNAKVSSFHHVTAMNTFIRIKPNGNVTHGLRLTVTASCPMDFRYFPMDSQICPLYVESFGYPTRDIYYDWHGRNHSIGIGFQAKSMPQFRMRGHREYKLETPANSASYSRLIVEFYFERSLGFYVIQVYIPAALIVLLSEVSFWISRESSPARISLGITTVLTMTTLISSTQSNLPKISYLKAIDVYLVNCFLMVFAALLEYACVAYTGKRCRLVKRRRRRKTLKARLHGSKVRALSPDNDDDGDGDDDDLNFRVDIDDDSDEDNRKYHFCIDDFSSDKKNCLFYNRLCSKASDIEKYSRILFPTVFICFNILYWAIYLNISVTHDISKFEPV